MGHELLDLILQKYKMNINSDNICLELYLWQLSTPYSLPKWNYQWLTWNYLNNLYIQRRCVSGLPGEGLDGEPESIEKLINLSRSWELRLLESICINMQQGEPGLNLAITVSHSTEMGGRLAQDFLLTNKWADVSFDVEGNVWYLYVLCLLCSLWNYARHNLEKRVCQRFLGIENVGGLRRDKR